MLPVGCTQDEYRNIAALERGRDRHEIADASWWTHAMKTGEKPTPLMPLNSSLPRREFINDI